MQPGTPPLDRILRIYALLNAAGGALLLVRTPRAELPLATHPFIAYTIVHLIAIVLILSAAFAAALAHVEEPVARRRGLAWLLGAQWIAALLLVGKYEAIFDWRIPTWPLALFLISLLLLTLWRLHNRTPHGARSASLGQLRSRYEEDIRRAAGQEERHRLARDLHDSIKQQIFAIHTAAATAQTALAVQPLAAAAAIDQVRSAARDAMTEMDTLLDQLQAAPLGMPGLIAALTQLAETTGLRTGAESVLEALPPAGADVLPPGAAEAVLRVAQEAHSNAARHARATRIVTRLETAAGQLVLSVADNGAGFDSAAPPAPGMGLRNMRTRAEAFGGGVEITSACGCGTTVRMAIPLQAAEPSGEHRRGMLATMALLAVVGLLWISGAPGGNPLQRVLLLSVAAAAAIFLALGWLRRSRAGATR